MSTFMFSCAGPGYYAQAIAGHFRLMNDRQSAEQVLRRPDLDPVMAQQIRRSVDILEFAEVQLSLPDSGSYTRVVMTGQEAVTWNVVAAPEFSTEPETWCFPVAGCVAYRGYFKAEKAHQFADKLARQSYDVMISPAVAYSTLGWFDDPLTDIMLRYDEIELAGIIFHELAHRKLYVKGDTAFSESFASFVEEMGVERWVRHLDRPDQFPEWQRRRDAAHQFNLLLKRYQKELDELYRSQRDDAAMRVAKSEMFGQMMADYRDLVEREWEGVGFYDTWLGDDPNNAHVALASSYQGGVCAFRRLFQSAGENPDTFYQLAAEKAELDAVQRKHWLESPCDRFASGGIL